MTRDVSKSGANAADFHVAGKKVFVAGHRGMVGRAVVERLEPEQCEVITAGRERFDLRDQRAVRAFLLDRKPDAVILAAARVGGILANSRFPADFIYDNLAIETNVIEGAFRAGVEKLVFLGSSCIYPKHAPQPMREDALLSGPLEPTNQWYAVAKIAGIKLCQAYRRQHGCDFISAMPTNLYGPHDNFDLASSHVLPALIRKFHDAKDSGAAEVEIWGTGSPMREFLHVDDLADACLHLMRHYSADSHINVGTGVDLSIRELAEKIRDLVYPGAELRFDTSKPDGTPRKVLDVGRLEATGWKPKIDLDTGVRETYQWFLDQEAASIDMRGIDSLAVAAN